MCGDVRAEGMVMYSGRFVFSQVTDHLPMKTFRCVFRSKPITHSSRCRSHHIRADLGRIPVPRRRRRLQPPGGGLVDGQPSARRVRARGAEHGAVAATARARRPSLGSRVSIYVVWVRQTLPRDGRRSVYGIGGRLLRQRDGRELLRHHRVRAPRPAQVPDPGRGPHGDLEYIAEDGRMLNAAPSLPPPAPWRRFALAFPAVKVD